MRQILFDGKNDVSLQDMVNKMNYYIEKAKHGMEIYEKDKKSAYEVARELRKELEAEYKNNSLNKISEVYKENIFFTNYYKHAVHESIASITGQLSYKNLFSFLYDINYYMGYYTPKKINN